MYVAKVSEAIMSIPPLLSSTPPPLEETGSVVDHDDDFGEFSDHASAGAVSSTTSVNDSSSLFRPIESADISCGLCVCDANLKPDSSQASDEWSGFDSAVVQPSFEPRHTDDGDMLRDQKLVADGSVSDCVYVGEPPACIPPETSADEWSTASVSTSQIVISERLNSEDDSSGRYSDVPVECTDENSHFTVQTVEKSDDNLCENVSSASDPQCRMDESKQAVEEEVSLPANDDHELEFDSAVDPGLQHSEDYGGFNMSSTVALSDRNDCGFASDNQSASDEKDFVGDFQSFGSDLEIHHDFVREDGQLSTANSDSASTSCKEQEASVYIETSATVDLPTTDSQSADTSCNADSSSTVEDSTTTAKEDEGISTDLHSNQEQMLASNEEVDDDFDDFEEYVGAKEGPIDHQLVVDSSTYQWNAFETTDAAGDTGNWAAFEESDKPLSTNSRSEVSDQLPVVTYSGQLSKVHDF